jgi:hypothetical protein
MAAASTLEVVLPDGTRKSGDALLQPWKDRADQARKARRPFEGQWMTSQAFAAGKQWVVYQPREHRVLEDPKRKRQGRSMQTANMLTQYLWTAIGKLAADDFRPQLLFTLRRTERRVYAKQANLAFGWGWDEEWQGDEILLDILHTLAVFGTGAIRCRYDRNRGAMIGDVPHAPANGYTHTDPTTGQQTSYDDGQADPRPHTCPQHVAEAKYYGEPLDLRPLREAPSTGKSSHPGTCSPSPDRARARLHLGDHRPPRRHRDAEGDLRRPRRRRPAAGHRSHVAARV